MGGCIYGVSGPPRGPALHHTLTAIAEKTPPGIGGGGTLIEISGYTVLCSVYTANNSYAKSWTVYTDKNMYQLSGLWCMV